MCVSTCFTSPNSHRNNKVGACGLWLAACVLFPCCSVCSWVSGRSHGARQCLLAVCSQSMVYTSSQRRRCSCDVDVPRPGPCSRLGFWILLWWWSFGIVGVVGLVHARPVRCGVRLMAPCAYSWACDFCSRDRRAYAVRAGGAVWFVEERMIWPARPRDP